MMLPKGGPSRRIGATNSRSNAMKQHIYEVRVDWTGNNGEGTKNYKAYRRDHKISVSGKPDIQGSSDPKFHGDPLRYNPEELLVASLSSCHMLWFLHLCSAAGVVVLEYVDDAAGTMEETADGGGHFTEVTLFPVITVASEEMVQTADALHEKANGLCFIA